VTEAPKPYPNRLGVSTNSGSSVKAPNMPKPMMSAAMFGVRTARRRSSRMSISGWRTRVSTATSATSSTTATASSARMRGEAQPQPRPSLIAKSSATRPPLTSRAPAQSTRPGERTGDSRTNPNTAAIATSARASPSQKIQCQPSRSTITPASGRPIPPPMPSVALISPIAVGTRSGGNSSRTIPNPSGNAPAATPWIARATISRAIESDTAASSVPTASTVRLASSRRRLPNMSPSLPITGVATEAVSRNALST
jgi:hypothetical protein